MTNEEIALTQPKGTRFVKNEVTVLGGQYSGVMNSGRSVTLSGDGVVQVPVNATLGEELWTGMCDHYSELDKTDNGDGTITYTLNQDGDKKACYIRMSQSATDGKLIRDLQANEEVHTIIEVTDFSTNEVTIVNAFGDDVVISSPQTITIIEKADGTTTKWSGVAISGVVGDSFTVRTTSFSVKAVEDVQGSVTYFDASQKEFIQVTHDGVNSKELVQNGDFSDGLDHWVESDNTFLSISNGQLVAERTQDGGNIFKYDTIFDNIGAGVISFDLIDDPDNSTNKGIILYGTDIEGTGKHYWYKAVVGHNYVTFTGTHSAELIFNAVNNAGAKTIWDNVSLKEILPLSTTYDLKDGEYGVIVKLHTNSFSHEDIDAFNTEPELLIDWYFGNRTIPSGIVKGADDKVYYPVDGVYLELDYGEGSERICSNDFKVNELNTEGDFNSTNTSFEYEVTTVGDNTGYPRFNTELADNHKLNSLYIVKHNIVQPGITYIKLGNSGITKPIKDKFNFLFPNDELTRLEYNSNGTSYYHTIVNGISVKEILSEHIPVEGAYTYNTRLNYGIQDIRLELNDAGIPTSVVTSKNNTNGAVNTGFKLYAADEYTVEETLQIGGETATWAWTSAGKVFKDGVEVGAYTVPADGTSLVLGNTTLDGQTITERHQTKVWTYIPHEYA